ncbi:hypothetical protein ACPRNU_23900 [Chromobacterium vaccinii]|uniref:hypothetical protein n=1 Tax=Chromobacterium vaccinii TaxID=1108595 RepID=UPI003C790D6F
MIKWEYGIVGFVDILGFSNIIEEDSKRLEPASLKRILNGLHEAREKSQTEGIRIVSFSDTIILSSELSADHLSKLIEKTIHIQTTLLRQNILTRGGIAFGKHFQNQDTLFSEALIKAYKIETSRAKFPRVVIDADLIDWVINDSETSTEQKRQIKLKVLKDKDTEFFLDYLCKKTLAASAEVLTKVEAKKITARILEKYQWLNAYHNYKCSQHQLEFSCDNFTGGFEEASKIFNSA